LLALVLAISGAAFAEDADVENNNLL